MRKGQFQINETILALVIFSVILLVVLIFFFRIQSSSISKIYDEFQEDRFYNLVLFVQDMPELTVPEGLDTQHCVDYYKARAFKDFSNRYKSEFGDVRISLEVNGEKEVIYENKPIIYTGERVIRSPICLYDERTNVHKIVNLEILWYER